MTDTFSRRVSDGSSLPRVRAVSRAVSILRAFSADQPYQALGEIVQKTGLDAGTTRRLLVTLRDEGLVHQDPASGRYAASVGLLQLGAAVPDDLSLKGVLEQHLIRLAEDTMTTVYLSVCSGDGAICLARHHGTKAIEVRWWAVGERRAFNIGTGPRVLLAYLDDDMRHRRMSELEGAEAAALRLEVEAIRKTGYLVKHDEIALGLSALAVPLLDENGACLAAVSLGGLTPNFVGAAQVTLLGKLQDAVDRMRSQVRGLRD